MYNLVNDQDEGEVLFYLHKSQAASSYFFNPEIYLLTSLKVLLYMFSLPVLPTVATKYLVLDLVKGVCVCVFIFKELVNVHTYQQVPFEALAFLTYWFTTF